ncbi:MAG: 3-oxoacyl-[acyl-carrier-protein] reductase [Defluviitaleaceae bacterium]|nr:3-oxoacyl-[acyl-carrier-protein] reductase [Defluviitaleaceae bacterium]
MLSKNILENKVAVVTGASRGIGLAIAQALCCSGAKVASVSRSECKAENGYICDVSNFDQVKYVCNQIISDFGKIDILVNNAGITKDNLLLSMKEEEFDSVVDINLKGAFNFTKHLARQLIKSGNGRIINMTSVIGVNGNVGQSNYAASKAGLIGFTKSMARELASRNVTCNAIAPGFIKSRMTDTMPETIKEHFLANIPLKRIGTVDEVAMLAVFLASDFASYITGEVIKVDGGMFI